MFQSFGSENIINSNKCSEKNIRLKETETHLK